MYRSVPPLQQSVEEYALPFSGKLSSENRWVVLSQLVPWTEFESEYAEQFSSTQGAPAKSFRVALGSLIIKERLGTSDEETVEQIRENPYLQYFLGFSEYTNTAPFDASMFVHFRKRITLSLVARVNERMVAMAQACQSESPIPSESPSGKQPNHLAPPPEPPAEPNDEHQSPPAISPQLLPPDNQGKLIIDASCAPSDIKYPTDLGLLNSSREHTEEIIDELYKQVKDKVPKKPRTYRQNARHDFLNISKKRRPSAKQRRQAIKHQLGYVRRNLAHIEHLLSLGASLSVLSQHMYRKLLVVSEVFRQQQWMYQQRTQRIDDRIVSLTQPHIRPIVRGKAGTPVEFGAKLSASCDKGFVFLDHLSWDNFNESRDLQQQAQTYKERHGHYPETIYADQIYRSRANREWCNARNIRLMGPPLGRVAEDQKHALRNQAREDAKIRNQIEGKFGQGKRRFSLARVMAKLKSTAETAIALCFLVMNLEHLLRQVYLFLFWLVFRWDSLSQRGSQETWLCHNRFQFVQKVL